MPYANNFRDVGAQSQREQVLAVFGSPALHSLRRVLDPAQGRGGNLGRRSAYPPLLQYAVAVTARIYRTQRRALKELGSGDLWAEACLRYQAVLKQPVSLPARPPSAAQQDRFIKWLAQPDLLEELGREFTRAAVRQAEHLGNFTQCGWPDYTRPDQRHTVLGDGAYIEPYSSVFQVVDEATGEIVTIGSRATTGSPRIQTSLTDPKLDGKTARGVNHVTLLTWTEHGWVVLANMQAFSAEVKAARALIADVHDLLGERLHTVVWDRVLTGKDLQDLMAERRLMVVTKPVARAHTRKRSDGYTAPELTDAQARALVEVGAPLPVGICLYPRGESRQPEVTRSSYYRYKTLLQDGCGHDLWVDDGALVAVEKNAHGWLVKTAQAKATHAVPVRDKQFTVDYAFRLRCDRAPGGHHEFSVRWQPQSSRPRSGEARAIYDLRPIARLDHEAFAEVYGRRNITESYNAWLKQSLGNHARATRQAVSAQFVDQISAATLANALTYHRYLARTQNPGLPAAA